ncbi:MAG TPA: sigma-70 family RNA polymerase sigma factor [Pseudonocardia sp.]|nr:sigma-70 family RNA polymerase sigma factor [Pseudonocardia sp.]
MTPVLTRPLPPPAGIPTDLDAPAGTTTEPLRAMFDDHGPALLAFAERFTTRESAQDAVQETFLRAWRNLPRLRTDPRDLRPWLLVVLRRVLIDAHRADRFRPISVAENDVLDRAIEDGHDRLLERWRLDHALDSLAPCHRQVLVGIYYRDTPSHRLAVELGIAPGTVRSRQHYALRAVRSQLTDAADPTGDATGDRSAGVRRRGEPTNATRGAVPRLPTCRRAGPAAG